jgi:hypothetical protein
MTENFDCYGDKYNVLIEITKKMISGLKGTLSHFALKFSFLQKTKCDPG